MGGRAVEGTGLENQQACKRLVGSNPTPSASSCSATEGLVRAFAEVYPVNSYFWPRERRSVRPGSIGAIIGAILFSNLGAVAIAQDCPYPMVKQSGVCTVVSSVPVLSTGPSLGDITLPSIEIVEPAVAVPAPAVAAVPVPAVEAVPAPVWCRVEDTNGNVVLREC